MIAMTWEARLPSGMVTTAWSRFFGFSSAAQARVACMWLLRMKKPGSRPVGLVLFSAASTNARVLATTPSFSSVGASCSAVSPLATWTVTVGVVPAPV